MDGIDRIQQVMDSVSMNQTQFAREIGVSGPTMSQLLSRARNQQPSLDVITKIVGHFPEISLEWLAMGSGAMHRDTVQSRAVSLFDDTSQNAAKSANYGEISTTEKQFEKPQITRIQPEVAKKSPETVSEPPREIVKIVEKEITVAKQITKIILYFSDNTFQEFMP
jgi:transcriptional regulator with XRE-family HTH domain